MSNKGYLLRFAAASAITAGIGLKAISSLAGMDSHPPSSQPESHATVKIIGERPPNRNFLYLENRVDPAHIDVSAYDDFCKSAEGKCETSPNMLSVEWDPEVAKLLNDVNDEINKKYPYKLDMENFGVQDKWGLLKEFGDCDDYAVTKRDRLLSDIPPAAMMIGLVKTKEGAHAVLIVRTTDGDKVLDNRFDKVVSLAATGYEYKYVTDPLDNKKWLDVTYNNTPEPKKGRPVASAQMQDKQNSIVDRINAAFLAEQTTTAFDSSRFGNIPVSPPTFPGLKK